jgi:hypothetical protein
MSPTRSLLIEVTSLPFAVRKALRPLSAHASARRQKDGQGTDRRIQTRAGGGGSVKDADAVEYGAVGPSERDACGFGKAASVVFRRTGRGVTPGALTRSPSVTLDTLSILHLRCANRSMPIGVSEPGKAERCQ